MGKQTETTIEEYRRNADIYKASDPTSFAAVSHEIKAAGLETAEQGARFENMVVSYLKLDPIYSDRFEAVMLWDDYQRSEYTPKEAREYKGDIGIDIVAIESGNTPGRKQGERCGIQCKFYDFNSKIDKKEVAPWLNEVSKPEFSSGIFFYTGDGLTKQATEATAGYTKKISFANQDTLSRSAIEWPGLDEKPTAAKYVGVKFDPRPHQADAIFAANEAFQLEDAQRANIAMACGTGKTFTSLKIAEQNAKKVLVLVPSISLIQQTLQEWKSQSDDDLNHRYIVVCSDKSAGNNEDDVAAAELLVHPTTDAATLAEEIKSVDDDDFLVVFSTYQSIAVTHEAQVKFGAPDFDLAIADEAHRTTGLERGSKKGQENSHFHRINEGAKVGEPEYIKADKRLYMTATPRVYADGQKSKAEKAGYGVFTMDDINIYGERIYDFGFQEAVDNGILTDYEVLVVTVPEEQYKTIADGMVSLDGKIIDSEKAILGFGLIDAIHGYDIDSCIMFNHRIKVSKGYKNIIPELCEEYEKAHGSDGREIEVRHIDGTDSASHRSEDIRWLSTKQNDLSRIITNARCFSEGVDIPSLSAIAFMSARASIQDCIQSVGRVMRKAEGKKKGYVILPVIASAGENEDDLSDEISKDSRYKSIWTTLQALRSHDDRFNEELNKGDLNRIKFVNPSLEFGSKGDEAEKEEAVSQLKGRQIELFEMNANFNSAIKATVLSSLSSERYWNVWSEDVASVFESVCGIVRASLEASKNKHSFDRLLSEFSNATRINVDEENGILLIASHIISKPIFEAIYPNYHLADNNPISRAIEKSIHEILPEDEVEELMNPLAKSYESIGRRAANIKSEEKKIEFIKSLYEKFIHKAMTSKAEKLGVAYTPIPMVDFVLRSAKSILKKELNMDLGKEANVYDPFSGTGVFLSRLIALDGIIADEDIEDAYSNRLHCKEFILLAYYVGDLLIEQAYNYRTDKIKDFDNAFMGDSFATNYEVPVGSQVALFDQEAMEEVSEFDKKKFQAILTNPPYSSGQKDASDDNQNESYPELEDRMDKTYGDEQNKGRSSKDSWLKGLRMATDKIDTETGGLVSFIHPSTWIEGKSYQGMRRHLVKEFDAIYVYSLRGDARKSGEERRREGGCVFEGAARVPICISVFVRHGADKHNEDTCDIYYKAVEDALKVKEKMEKLNTYGDMLGIDDLTKIVPDEHGEWLNQVDPKFFDMMSMGDHVKDTPSGIQTGYDELYVNSCKSSQESRSRKALKKIIEWNDKEILTPSTFEAGVAKSNSNVHSRAKNGKIASQPKGHTDWTRKIAYRPFFEQYTTTPFLNLALCGQGLLDFAFPEPKSENIVLSTDGKGNLLLLLLLPEADHHTRGAQLGKNYPLYKYENGKKVSNINQATLEEYRNHYGDDTITEEDVFYYTAGCLASSSFQQKWEVSRTKEKHCRVPFAKNFEELVEAGRKIAGLHLKLNSIDSSEPGLDLQEIQTIPNISDDVKYRIGEKKMKFNAEKGELKINDALTIGGIPKEMSEWVYNEKSAIGWIVDRYVVSYGKTAEIKNDPNLLFDTPDGFVKHLSRVAKLTVECLAIQRSMVVEVDDESDEAATELVEGSHTITEDGLADKIIDTQADTVASIDTTQAETNDLNPTQTPPSMNGTTGSNPSIEEIDRQMAELQALRERVLANGGQEVQGVGTR